MLIYVPRKILENSVKNNVHDIKTKKSLFYLNRDFSKKYPLLVIKAYLLMMIIMFFSVAYNRFIYFVLIGTLLLSIYIIFKIKLDQIFKTKLTQRIVHYILLLVLSGITVYFIREATFDHTDADSASSFIGLIVQSEAAIIAIVVTLSLVAVQQTSSSYSARVINIFKDGKRNPDFFILMGTYAFCIIYGAYLIKIIEIPSSGNTIVDPSFENYIWFLYASFIFSLLALGSYILDTLEMFKPSVLIKVLSENISKEAIESAIKLENSNNVDERGKIQPINDTIQPIIDVLQGSMMTYDYETTRYGLRIVENKAIQILKDKNYDSTYKEAIANRIIDYITVVGDIAVKQKMERTVIDTYQILLNIENVLIDEKIYSPIPTIVYSLKKIGGDSSNEGSMLDSSIVAINLLQKNGEIMIENDNKNIVREVIDSIGEIGADATIIQNKGSSKFIDCVIESLEKLGEKVARKKWVLETGNVTACLGTIGEKLIENEPITREIQYLEMRLLSSLSLIARVAIDQDFQKPVYGVSAVITNIGISASDKNIFLANQTKECLDGIHTLLPDLLDISPDNTWIKLGNDILANKKRIESSMEKSITV